MDKKDASSDLHRKDKSRDLGKKGASNDLHRKDKSSDISKKGASSNLHRKDKSSDSKENHKQNWKNYSQKRENPKKVPLMRSRFKKLEKKGSKAI